MLNRNIDPRKVINHYIVKWPWPVTLIRLNSPTDSGKNYLFWTDKEQYNACKKNKVQFNQNILKKPKPAKNLRGFKEIK